MKVGGTTLGSLAGQLQIHFVWSPRTGALTSSERPVVQLQRPAVLPLLVGRPPAEVAALIPRLFSLCGNAQGALARALLTDDTASSSADETTVAQQTALWTELLHEHFWHLLIAWPQLLGLSDLLARALPAFAAWRAARGTSALIDISGSLCEERIWAEWMPRCLSALDGPMSAVRAAYSRRCLAIRQAIADWRQEQAYPLTVVHSGRMRQGHILTARGRLSQSAVVDAGQVIDFALCAPTDGHFADASALEALLAGQTFNDLAAARQAVALAVLALDPCVPNTIQIDHA